MSKVLSYVCIVFTSFGELQSTNFYILLAMITLSIRNSIKFCQLMHIIQMCVQERTSDAGLEPGTLWLPVLVE